MNQQLISEYRNAAENLANLAISLLSILYSNAEVDRLKGSMNYLKLIFENKNYSSIRSKHTTTRVDISQKVPLNFLSFCESKKNTAFSTSEYSA